jgi:DNA-binding MarR family transcriptional regulator
MNGPFSVGTAQDSSGFLFWKVSTLWQRGIRDTLEPLGLTHTQFVLLASLRWLGGASQASLSRHTGCDTMTVSAVARTLAAKGWVDRQDDSADRRAKVIRITPAGIQIVDQAIPFVETFDRQFFENRLSGESPAFLESLRTLSGL